MIYLQTVGGIFLGALTFVGALLSGILFFMTVILWPKIAAQGAYSPVKATLWFIGLIFVFSLCSAYWLVYLP